MPLTHPFDMGKLDCVAAFASCSADMTSSQ
jgi:hypothetical protein